MSGIALPSTTPHTVRVAIAAAFVACAASASHAGPLYHVTDLGFPSYASQVNREGYVSGETNQCPGVWQDGAWRLLRADCRAAVVTGVNKSGSASGTVKYNVPSIAVVWKPDGYQVRLVPDAKASFGMAIRTDGTVYGAAQPTGSHSYPFSWNDNVLTQLPYVSGWRWTMPVGVNKSKWIAATVAREPDLYYCPMKPALYRNGAWKLLGTLGGTCAWAKAINDSGVVVGTSYLADGTTQRAFSWEDGVMTQLGTLGGQYTRADDINVAGDIVGFSTDTLGAWHPVLFRAGAIIELDTVMDNPPAGVQFTDAVSINDVGQIVVNGNQDGRTHAVLLTPIP